MNWITKKIVLSKLSQYFTHLNQDDIEISILINHHIKLKNMSLKTQIFASNEDFLIPTQCRIGFLQLEFDFSNETPINIKVAHARIILKINENMKEQKPVNDLKIIKEYHHYLKMKQEYGYKSFFQRKKQQLKDWFIGLLGEKTSLFIKDIQVAIQYPLQQRIHYIGVTLENINIKSRTIINEQSINQQERFVQLSGLGMFVGIENEVNMIKKQGQNRQTWILKRSINKLYFLKNCEVSFRLNLFNKIAEAQIQNFIMNASPTALKHIMEFSRYLIPLLNRTRPRSRPGQGDKVRSANTLITKGTVEWWKYLSLRVMQLVSKRRRYNILLNPSYRKYLYCLLLAFVYEDKHPQVLDQIYSFEVNRPILQILKARQYLIQRINSIQSQLEHQRKENIGFIKLIGSFKKFGYLAVKEIKYHEIERSRKWNIQNGRNYIKKLQIQSLFKFQIRVQCKKMSIFICQNTLLYDFVKLNKMEKMNQNKNMNGSYDKDEYILKVGGNFLKHAWNEITEGFRKDQFQGEWNIKNIKNNPHVITSIDVKNLVADIETNSKIQILVDSVEIKDLNKIVYQPEVLIVKNISVLQTLVNREMRTASLDEQNAKLSVSIQHISLTAQKPFVQKLIFLMGLVQLDIAAIQTVVQFQKTMRQALYQNISKSSKKGQQNQISFSVKKLNVLLPCDYSTKGDILGLQLLGISVGILKNIQFMEVYSIRLALVNSFGWKDQKQFSLIETKQQKVKESLIMSLGQMRVQNKNVIDKKSKVNKHLGPNIISMTEFIIPLIAIQISIKQLFLLTYLITLWKTTQFAPLSTLYVKWPMKKRKNHQYLSQNEQVLINNVNQRLSFSILGIVISFISIKKQKQQFLFWVFLNQFDLDITKRSFSSVIDARIGEIYVENVSNHLPINRGILERFMNELLKEGDKRKKNKNNRGMDSLNLLLDKDISGIQQKESFKMKNSGSFNLSLDGNDPQQILNAFEFREGEKNYLNKKLILMNEGQKVMKITITDFYNVQTHQQEQIIKIIINPIHVLFQVIFFRNLKMIVDFALAFSSKKMQNFYDYMKDKGILPLRKKQEQEKFISFIDDNSQQKQLIHDQKVIIDAKLSKYTKIQMIVHKVIFMIFHHNTVIYCLKAGDIRCDIEQKYLFTDMTVSLDSLYIVDTKPDSGKNQEIASLKGGNSNMKISFRVFKNQTLISRHNCKSTINIKISGLQAVVLKKKIIQLIDIFKYFSFQLKDKTQETRIVRDHDTITRQQQEKQLQQQSKSTLGSHFVVELIDSRVKLMQSSVLENHFITNISKIIISNKSGKQPTTEVDNFKDTSQFQQCSGLDQNNEQFISFENQRKQETQAPCIFISAEGIDVFDQFDRHQFESIISANQVSLEINTQKEVRIGIIVQLLQGALTQDQYTFIMRMVDQNFDEVPQTLTPRAPQTEALSINISIIINGIYLSLNIPRYDIEVESQGLYVKVFMYDNDKKEIRLGVYDITIANLVKNDRQIIMRSFVPSEQKQAYVHNGNNTMLQQFKKYEVERQFDNNQLIIQKQGLQQAQSIKMSMIDNREKFYEKEYNKQIDKEDTNYTKLAKCLARFCCSCWCCNKRNRKSTQNGQQDQIRSNQRLMSHKELDLQIPPQRHENIEDASKFKGEHIEDSRLIIRRKFYPSNVFQNCPSIDSQFLKLVMFTQPNPSYQGFKKIKVENVSINAQQHLIIKALVNFVSYPFTVPNSNMKYNRKYNIFPPNTLDLELNNIRLVIGHGIVGYLNNSIEVLVNLKFVMQDEGDTKYGPGQQKWDVNACMNVNYCKGNRQNEYIPISLCKDAKFLYTKNSKIPYYRNIDQVYLKKQRIYLTGNKNQINFKLPITELKIIQKLFNKLNQSNPDGSVSTDIKPDNIVPFGTIHQQMKMMIPSLTIELQRGLSRALVEVSLANMYLESQGLKSSEKDYQKKTTAVGTILGNYVNMSTGNVEPFIQAWTFEAKTEQSMKQAQLVKLIKLSSRNKEDAEGINCLNINVTTSLLKNLKDVETRYKNQGVVLEDCFYNLLDRKGHGKQVIEGDQDMLLTKYKLSNVDHRNFFGKKFVRMRGGKSLAPENSKYWNFILEPYIMFHSFLDQSIGRKIVHLRTPFSIHNLCGTTVNLIFDIRRKASKDIWEELLRPNQTYPIPLNIYNFDYLVTITLEKQPQGKAVSILGMLKQYEQRSEFQDVTDWHPLFQRAFRLLEGNPKKYISKNDTVLKAGNNILLASTVKIQYQLLKTGFYNQQEKVQKVYETNVMVLPPLIIKNQLSMRMQMFIQDESIIIEPNSERIIIDLPQNLVQIKIYFKKVMSSKRFSIFQQTEPISIYKIHISEGYNINMKCVRMSQLSRYLVLYSNYIIKNFTQQNFQIFHKGNKVLLERSYWFFITQDQDNRIDTKYTQINFYKGQGEAHKFDPNLKKQGFKLKKYLQMDDMAPLRIRMEDDNYLLPGNEDQQQQEASISKCCKKKKSNRDVNSKIMIFEFVIWIKNHRNQISRIMCIYYKYEVKNNTEEEFTLYHQDVQVFSLAPGKRQYLFQYESNSNRYRMGLVLPSGVKTYSRPFKLDTAQDFIVKIKQFPQKMHPYDRNHLFRVVISQQQDLFLIQFFPAPAKQEFQMYLQNSTMHNARIRETDQDFNLAPRQRIPFFWSNLDFQKSNVLFVEIQGHSKQFVMNKLDSFQPLVLEEMNNKQQPVGITYKKGFLRLSYNTIKGQYFCVCDVLQQAFIIFHKKGDQFKEMQRIRLLQAAYMNTNGRHIFIYLPDGQKITLLAPSDQQYNLWREVINNSLTVRTFHKIMLRMESTDNARILKLYELKGDQTKTIKRVEYTLAIGSLAVTLINAVPKQILLLGIDKLKLFSSQEFRSSNFDTLVRIKQQNIFQFGKMKLNNNLEDTQNPVIQAGSKKTDNPYFQIKTIRTYYHNYNPDQLSNVALLVNKDKQMNHYNVVKIFLDETQVIIDNANYAQMKKVIEEINKMVELYSIHDGDKKMEKDIDIRQSPQFLKHAHTKGLYINQLSIQPMKIVLSANWNASNKELETSTHLAILKAMPFGIDHAVIQLKGITFYHINQNTEVLLDRMKRHYTQDIVFQILRNAGSYDLFVPLKIIGGVGSGAKDIFYDPIYTLFTKRDIKYSSSKVLEGCVGFLSTIVQVIFKFVEVIFRILAFLTFDTNYNARRNALLRTTMKNPKFAFVHAGYWWLKLIPQVFTGFYTRPKQQYQTRGAIAIPFGLLSACMGHLKPVIGVFDFIYCLIHGFMNMSNYEPEPMKFRTRPVRLFKNNIVMPYNRYQALAHQIMYRNKIQEIKNEFVQFAQEIYLNGGAVFIIITNYRFITSKETYSYNSIKLYKIKQVYRRQKQLHITLNIADLVSCCICLTRKKSDFVYRFDKLEKAQIVEELLKEAINKNSHNPLEKSQVFREIPAIRTTKTSKQ